jgi:hypothetical protein
VNVPTNEMNELADDDKMEFTKTTTRHISNERQDTRALSVDDDAKASAIQSLKNAEEAVGCTGRNSGAGRLRLQE